MPMYQRLGELPAKRHSQLWQGDRLLTEQFIGHEGFAGNYSLLYHLTTPCRVAAVGSFATLERSEWVPDAHQHHLLDTTSFEAYGDELSGRRLLMFNDDVEIWFLRPAEWRDGYFRSGDGDELYFVHEGSGTLRTVYGTLPYGPGDYLVVPRGTTYRFDPAEDTPHRMLLFHSPGQFEVPRRYRNEYGDLLAGAPMYNRDMRTPEELETFDEGGEFRVTVRIRGGYQEYVMDRHPFNVAGWDGYLYPWAYNINDFEPITGRVHQPPPVHQTFAGRNFVICSFMPRVLDWDPQAVPIPYNHSNVDSDEMIYYLEGNFSSRKGVDVGAITLHPYGIPHGPQPGLAEAALGAKSTAEKAVMCDTFHPLRLTEAARQIDDLGYMYSWMEEPLGGSGDVPSIP